LFKLETREIILHAINVMNKLGTTELKVLAAKYGKGLYCFYRKAFLKSEV
jgi:hypothetical protein